MPRRGQRAAVSTAGRKGDSAMPLAATMLRNRNGWFVDVTVVLTGLLLVGRGRPAFVERTYAAASFPAHVCCYYEVSCPGAGPEHRAAAHALSEFR